MQEVIGHSTSWPSGARHERKGSSSEMDRRPVNQISRRRCSRGGTRTRSRRKHLIRSDKPQRHPPAMGPSCMKTATQKQQQQRIKPSLSCKLLTMTSILIVLTSHSVPSIKQASCYQFSMAQNRMPALLQPPTPSQVLAGRPLQLQGQQRRPPPQMQARFDINQLPTLSSETAHLLPADFSELPGDQVDWARKLNIVPASQVTQIKKLNNDQNNDNNIHQESLFNSPPALMVAESEDSEQLIDEGTLAVTQQPPPAPLMPKLANLFASAGGQQPFRNLINNSLLLQHHQSNLGRAIEATRVFVRQHQALSAAASSTNQAAATTMGLNTIPRAPLIQLPGARLYNFLVQARAQQQQQRQQQQQQQPQLQLLAEETADFQEAPPPSSSGKKRGVSGEISQVELIQPSASSQNGERIALRNKLNNTTTRSLITLSAPYEQRPRPGLASSSGEQRKEMASGKSGGLIQAASGQHAFAADFNQGGGAENSTLLETIDPQQSENQPQRHQQFVVGSEESEGGQQISGQSEQQQQQQQSHLQNQDQANAEFQASLQGTQEYEQQAEQQAQQHQSAESPQELAGYIEQGQQQSQTQHQQQQQGEELMSVNNLEVDQEANGAAQTSGDDNRGESIYLTPGHHLSANGSSMLAPLNESDLSPASMASLQTDEVSLVAAAQLPSQYDSTLRLPPDGHYDDYFKPSGASTSPEFAQVASGTSSLLSHQDNNQQNLLAQEFYTPLVMNSQGNHSTNQQSQRHHQSFMHANQSFIEQPQQAAHFFQQQQQQQQPMLLASNGTPIDYTIQYDMSQQPVNQTNTRGQQSIEFVTTTNQTIGGQARQPARDRPQNHGFFQHIDARPQRQVKQQQAQVRFTHSPNATVNHVQQQITRNPATVFVPSASGANQTLEEFQAPGEPVEQASLEQQQQAPIAGNEYQVWNQSSASLGGGQNQTEDSIQLIVANSNSFQDPNTNERLITYTSEGRNFTRPNGKSARKTFFNKDLNELPPAERDNPFPMEQLPASDGAEENVAHNNHRNSNANQTRELVLQIQPAKYRSTRSPLIEDNPANHRVLVVLNTKQPQVQPQPQQYRLMATVTTTQAPVSTERSSEGDIEETDEEGENSLQQEVDSDQEVIPSHFGQFGERQQVARPAAKQSQNQQQAPKDKRGKTSGGKQVASSSQTRNAANSKPAKHEHDQEQQLRASRNYRSKGAMPTQQQQPVASGSHHHHRNFKTNNHSMRQQQTMKRPQVTEARFQLKDLPLNPPTAMPSVSESTMRSIETLPTKVRQIRNKQVDKNELMNELLTALDRVKSAIYKLQPLTAKMNAMYRKSVTSNTRDHIMDNHKGTYAKRYPPGDYDDTYDRMQPVEMLDRQRNQHRSARRRRNDRSRGRVATTPSTNDEDQISGSDSKVQAVYLPAPSNFTDGANEKSYRNRTKSDRQRQVVIASGFGKRMGALGPQMHGRLSFSTPTGEQQILYDDDVLDQSEDEDDRALNRLDFEQFKAGKFHLIKNASATHLENQLFSRRNGTEAPSTAGQQLFENEDDEKGAAQNPLFGYKITIYQPLEREGLDLENNSSSVNKSEQQQEKELLSYSLVSDASSPELSFNTVADSEPTYELALDGDLDGGIESTSGRVESEKDLMATSESSLAPSQAIDQEEGQDEMDGSESSKSKKKSKVKKEGEEKHKKLMMEEEEGHKKKEKKEKGDKKGEKFAKHQAKQKKGEEEHKKKKEFKKIKHSKGVMSKESHKLHRDKHIKAHDRGAAKEKALKERTTIEFFEREQIVDDEFEKGKKSTMKAGWASGHDAKKVDKEHGGGGGDSMSMGGSHPVKHLEAAPQSQATAATSPIGMMVAASEHGDGGHLEKGHGHSMETSSGKQSNKFEKKHMEAKGKKFKGWREKGYKITTETEFIDRGSLHDSAYKKRDKGGAHHQKFKKHEANSEGHHGSVHEHHKKSHKKEEKKSKMEERKKEMMGKEEGEKGKKQKKASKKEMGDKKGKKSKHEEEKSKNHGDHDEEESAPTMASVGGSGSGMRIYRANQYDDDGDDDVGGDSQQAQQVATTTNDIGPPQRNQTRSQPTASLQINSSTLRPIILPSPPAVASTTPAANLIRFLPADHHDQARDMQRDGHGSRMHSHHQMQATNISRRSSDGMSLNNSNNSTLVDILNRFNLGARQLGDQGLRADSIAARNDEHRRDENSSPLLRLINNFTRQQQNNSSSLRIPVHSPTPKRSSFDGIQQSDEHATRSLDEANFNRSLERFGQVLANLNQAKTTKPLNRAPDFSNQRQHFERSEAGVPAVNLGMQSLDVMAQPRDLNPFTRLIQPIGQAHLSNHPTLYQSQPQQHFYQNPQGAAQSLQQQMFPQVSMLSPPLMPAQQQQQQQLAEQSNRLELFDQLNAFDLNPEMLNSALPPPSPLTRSQHFSIAPPFHQHMFTGNLLNE